MPGFHENILISLGLLAVTEQDAILSSDSYIKLEVDVGSLCCSLLPHEVQYGWRCRSPRLKPS